MTTAYVTLPGLLISNVPGLLISGVALGTSVASFRLNRNRVRLERDMQLVYWAQPAIAALVEGWIALKTVGREPLSEDGRARLEAAQRQLSIETDRGRFSYPNIGQAAIKTHILPPSRRGYRHAALDELVAVFDLIEDILNGGSSEGAADKAMEARRWFVDAIINEIHGSLHTAFLTRVTDRQLAQQSENVMRYRST